MNREQLRRSYKPRKVKLLFIGESPPASGRFFYARNSGLYRAMRHVFTEVDHTVNEENFLDVCQAAGCYLVDLALNRWTTCPPISGVRYARLPKSC